MTLIGLSALTMVALVGLVAETDAQTPCPEIGATAQRGHRGMEAGEESTGIGALRIIYSFLIGRESDSRVRK
jgi:hypothetical protein